MTNSSGSRTNTSRAARLAAKIGVDFIDLKQCHRYLLSELLAAKNRPGPYGGSLENRTRLIRQVIGRIRDESPGLLLATRFNAYDGIPYRAAQPGAIGEPCPHHVPLVTAFGTDANDHLREDLAEPIQLVRWLCDWGVRLINVTAGNPYSNPHVVRPADSPPVDGYDAPEHPLLGVLRHFRLARAIQAAVPERSRRRQRLQLAAGVRAARGGRECGRRLRRPGGDRPRGSGPARLRAPPAGRRPI